MFTRKPNLLNLALVLALLMPGAAQPIAEHTPHSQIAFASAHDGATAVGQGITLPNAQNVELVGQIGGASYAVAVQGSYAYVGIGPRLVILNIANPASLIITGQTTVLPGVIRDVAVVGNYAYVADYDRGLRIINVSNPAAPTEVGFYDTPGYAYGVAVAGNYAYVADWDSGLRIINVSNPAAPTEVGFYDTPGSAGGVAVAGNYVYVADLGSGLRIINVSNPAAPIQAGYYDTPGSAWGVAVAGNYAYVADDWYGGLRIINVSNPTAPIEAGYYNYGTLVVALDVAVVGNYAYVTGNSGLRIINVSNPAAPTEVSFYDTPGSAWGVAVAGNHAYVADYGGGLRIINVSNPAAPTEVGFYDTPGFAYDVAVVGNYANVADYDRGLRILNVSNPAAPTEVGYSATSGFVLAVAVVGNYAYLTDWYGGLHIINVSNPAAPTEVGFYDTPGIAHGVAVVGNYAYIANGWPGGLRIINVSNPATPTEVGYYNTFGSYYDVAVVGSYAYVADYDRGLHIINVSNPAAPTEVGFYDTPGYPQGVAVVGNYAYVADGESGLRIINVSNPAAPTEVGFYDTPGFADDVAVVGNFAYVADEDGGLLILRFTASISGQVKDSNGNPVPGVIISDGKGHKATTGSDGKYALVGLTAGDYTLTPEKGTSVYTGFSPATISINGLSSDLPGQDFTARKPVVVLVHGWHGFGSTDTCDSNTAPYPVTDVNSIPNNISDFGPFPKNLIADGWDVWLAHVATGPLGTPYIEVNASCLEQQLASIRSQTGLKEVAIIAHSMGGLVSRAFMESDRYEILRATVTPSITQLITLGTPHTGATYLIVPCATPFDYAACEMIPLGAMFFNLRFSSRADGTTYHLIGGDLTPPLGYPLVGCDGLNDGVIGVRSSTGRTFPTLCGGLTNLVAVDGNNVLRYTVSASHGDIWAYPSYFKVTSKTDPNPTVTYKCVLHLLDPLRGGLCNLVTATEDAQAQSIPAFSNTPTLSGHLSTSQVASRTLPIDTSGQSQFSLNWDSGTVSFILTNPFNTVIDPPYATAHPSEVTYTVNTDPGSQLFAAYTFNTTVPGTYTLTITAGDVGAGGADYSASALVDSPRTLSIATDKTLYAIGDTATITATLKNGGTGLTGATAQAKIYRPGVITDTVTLTDQGGGIYSGTYLIPNVPGYLGLSVTAEGNDAGTAYARQVDSLLAVSPNTAQLSGSYSDSATDDDGDGKYDSLNVNVGLNATQAGNYLLSGDLVSGSTIAAHSVISTTLSVGSNTPILSFNGDEIGQSGLNGPYTLTNVTVADQQNAGVPAVWQAANVYTTATYTATDFAATCYTLNLAANPPSGGTLTPDITPNCNGGTQYTSGSVMTLTSTANAGYNFAGWSGDTNGATNPLALTMDDDKTAIADFSATLGAPSLLSLPENGLTTIYSPTLDWSDLTPAPDHYEIQIATDNAFSNLVIADSVTDSTYTTIVPLAPNSKYYWRVRAFNAAGQFSPWSIVRSFRTALLSPESSFPGGLSQPSGLRPLFDWGNVGGASSYSLQISTNQNFTTLVLNLNVSPSAYVPTADLPKGMLLFWRVRTNGTNGPSAWSRVRHFDSPNPPGVPTLLTPAHNATVANGQPTLDWSDSSPGVDHYEVQISTNSTFTAVLGRGRGGRTGVSQYTPEAALGTGDYHWRVRAVNAQGQFSQWSAARSFSVP